MAVVGLDVKRRVPLAGGRAFGEAGPYELITGTVRFAADPNDPHNAEIVDLGLAPREPDGKVHFAADFALLQPADPQRGNSRLLFDVLNRGTARALAVFNDGGGEPCSGEELDPGNGFLMRQGYAVAWCGWQQDLPPHGSERMGLDAPVLPDPVQGLVLCEFQPAAPAKFMELSDLDHQPYPPADPNDSDAALSVREHTEAPRKIIPRDQWRFADTGLIELPAGFQPGLLYEAVYRAKGARVVGLGLLSARDCVSWLKYGEYPGGPSTGSGNVSGTATGPSRASGNVPPSPTAGEIRYAYGFGRSQSGRFLRHLLHLGLNEDEQGRPVFDGVIPLVAGARRGEFNVRFGQPSKTLGQGVGALAPFSGLPPLHPGRMQYAPTQPTLKTININSSAEYWGGDRGSGGQASLLHTDPTGSGDVEPPEDARVYLLAGTQHVGVPLPPARTTATGITGRHAFNCINYNPYLRAALVALDRWVAAGEAPPPSRVPRVADGSALPPDAVAASFDALPDVRGPLHLPRLHHMDFGEGLATGVPDRLPPALGEPYVHYVCAVDPDGNEVTGIRPPEVAVPLATYTGWNVRDASCGAPGELIPMTGSTIPFPRTDEEAKARHDPRRSIAGRYSSKQDYLRQARAAAEALVNERYMLEEDVERVLARMGELWDRL